MMDRIDIFNLVTKESKEKVARCQYFNGDRMYDYRFNPEILNVEKGDLVVVINKDNTPDLCIVQDVVQYSSYASCWVAYKINPMELKNIYKAQKDASK